MDVGRAEEDSAGGVERESEPEGLDGKATSSWWG